MNVLDTIPPQKK